MIKKSAVMYTIWYLLGSNMKQYIQTLVCHILHVCVSKTCVWKDHFFVHSVSNIASYIQQIKNLSFVEYA